ncbi:MAG: hypothetical protein HW421_2628 [Ignavibacteria bacterium]|nr:hypothetical protein [Ignavibacteria bacterium]
MPHLNEDIIAYRIARARETIDDAKIAIDNGKCFNAENRIYYAIFYIVSALSLKDGFSSSKHKQLMGWFNYNYIKTGKINKDFGNIYRNALKNRQESDYEDCISINLSDVKEHYNDMLLFVAEIEKLINEGIENNK